MISVLIPVYRYTVIKLVHELHEALTALNITFEIRLIDDNSPENERQANRSVTELNGVFYSELGNNIGRSAIRNLLAKESQYEWLWFLDCDSEIGDNRLIAANFWRLKSADTLLSGGRIYAARPKDSSLHLHWEWASTREIIDPELRMKDPVNNFLSNNFFLNRSLLLRVPFNESLIGYGYEDTLFASSLLSEGFKIVHINNPVIHAGLESTEVFLKKIEESLHNLLRLEKISTQQGIQNPINSKLYRVYKKISYLKLIFVFKFVSSLTLNWLKNKASLNPKALYWFDLYRLFYLTSITDE